LCAAVLPGQGFLRLDANNYKFVTIVSEASAVTAIDA
jgi:hypothetical protein